MGISEEISCEICGKLVALNDTEIIDDDKHACGECTEAAKSCTSCPGKFSVVDEDGRCETCADNVSTNLSETRLEQYDRFQEEAPEHF